MRLDDDNGVPARRDGPPSDTGPEDDDVPLSQLDDMSNREELRRRYYGLLQELRVVLPGVQVLLAFLFAVPFTERFDQMDDLGRWSFGAAILAALLAVICFLTPAAIHRVGPRTARGSRLRWSIRLTMVGMAWLAVALVSALWAVSSFVVGWPAALVVTVPVALLIPGLWVALPLVVGGREDRGGPRSDG